jgi:hypothetical protein
MENIICPCLDPIFQSATVEVFLRAVSPLAASAALASCTPVPRAATPCAAPSLRRPRRRRRPCPYSFGKALNWLE